MIASSNPTSTGLIASIARAAAITGSVISLVSSPAQPSPSSATPRCTWASTNPGSSQPPAASTTSAPSGISSSGPSAARRPSRTRTVPSKGSPSIGTTWALVIAGRVMPGRSAGRPAESNPRPRRGGAGYSGLARRHRPAAARGGSRRRGADRTAARDDGLTARPVPRAELVPLSSEDDDGGMASISFHSNPVTTVGELPAKGSALPAFELVGQDLAPASSADLAGKRVVLNVFPSLDTGTCAMSVRRFNELAAGLENTVVVCVSKDLPFAQARFCGAEGIENVVTGSAFRSSFGEDYG